MNSPNNRRYEFGPFVLDGRERLLLRDGQAITLTPKAFETLLLLVANNAHVLTKEELLSSLWPDTFVEEANLTNNISLLRKALGEDSEGQQYIKTVPRVGYRFMAEVRQAQEGHDQAGASSIDNPGAIKPPAAAIPLPSPRKRWKLGMGLVLVSLVIAALIGGLIFLRQRTSKTARREPVTIRSLAVLPLSNLSGDQSQDYFADGMTDELITSLSKIENLLVISRASAMQYKGARKPTLDIARELNVDAIVDGSVLRSGDRVRITVQLIHGATDTHLWAESYERDLRDVLGLQGDVGRTIANEIRHKLTPQEQRLMANSAPVKPEALDAYLKGRDYLNHGINEDNPKQSHELLTTSITYFDQAVRIDPNFARAYAGSAAAYQWLASSSGLPEFFPKSKEAATRALQIDDTLAEAHSSLAFVLHVEWDWAGAEREYRRAIELNPNSAHHGYALLLSDFARHDEAIREIQLAEKLDPLEVPLKVNMGAIYLFARQYDRAIEQFKKLLNVAPDDPYLRRWLGEAYLFKGMHDQGLAELRKAVEGEPRGRTLLAWAYAVAGNKREAIEILDESLKRIARGEKVSKRRIALIYTALGDKDQAFAWLEKAYDERSGLASLKVEPAFDSLRSDRRFADLMSRVGLPQ